MAWVNFGCSLSVFLVMDPISLPRGASETHQLVLAIYWQTTVSYNTVEGEFFAAGLLQIAVHAARCRLLSTVSS
jgi:hypothetical protein